MENRQHLIVAVTTLILVLAIVSYGLRLYAKRITAAHVWWDDYMVGIGLVFATLPCISNYVGLTYGFGLHVDTLPKDYPENYLKLFYAHLLGWMISETTIKYGILLFYWRVFPGKYFRWLMFAVGAFFMACFISGFITFALQCVPVRGFWDQSIHARCVNQPRFFDGMAALALIGNVILLVQPLPIILRLKASRQNRIGLCVVFMTGGVVVIISACRLASLKDIDYADITYSNVPPALWTAAEVTIGVVSANLPFLRPLFHASWTKIHTSHSHNQTPTTPSPRPLNFSYPLPRPRPRLSMGLTSTSTSTAFGTTPRDLSSLEMEMDPPPRGIKVRTDLEMRIERAGSPQSLSLSQNECGEGVRWPRAVVLAKGRKGSGWM